MQPILHEEFKDILLSVRNAIPQYYTNEIIIASKQYSFTTYKNKEEIRVYYIHEDIFKFKIELRNENEIYKSTKFNNSNYIVKLLKTEFNEKS